MIFGDIHYTLEIKASNEMRKFSGYFLSIIFVLAFGLSSGQNQSDKILELINIINFSYVDSVDNQKLTDAAIVAMLASLDPHSMYIPKDQVKTMNESLNGSFDGIGVQFNIINDTVVVVSPIAGGPAEKLGITSGDRIITADETIVSGVGITDTEVMKLLRGSRGSQVKISIKKNGVDHNLEYLITRDKIPIYSVDAAYMIDDKTGYIKVNRFSMTTNEEVNQSIVTLKKQNMQNLILDLRGNGGGFLYSSVEIADEFIDENKTIVSTKGLRQNNQVYSSTSKGVYQEGKLVVIIDEGSASASEILAGAIQDWDRGIIIGRRSFGKGLVMKPYNLSDGSVIRLTTSRYYTPTGRSIQKDYEKSKDVYDNEINERYDNGEFSSIENLELPDSLRFKTANGRMVYGGGGIIPDVFVPIDTSIKNKDFQNMLRQGAFTGFAVAYLDKNKNALLKNYKNGLELSTDKNLDLSIFSEFETFCQQKEIVDHKIPESIKSKTINYIKAYFARQIWNNETYFQVLNSEMPEIKRALDVIYNEESKWKQLTVKSE